MIYRLPTKGQTRYRGEHPQNIRSVAAYRGLVHLELQDGSRYVGRYGEFLDLPRYGQGITNFLLSGRFTWFDMTGAMYDALLRVTRDHRSAPDGRGKRPAYELVKHWDAVFGAEVR